MMSNRHRLPLAVAELIAEDLPDGARFALIEDLTGLNPADLVYPSAQPSRPAPEKRFICPVCYRRFFGKGALRQHTRDKHPTTENA